MTQSRVNFEINDNIAHVSLNRPDKHNGLDMPMFHSLIAVAKKIKRNKHIRAVILQGNGQSFCAGLDFQSMSKDKWMAPKLFLKWPWKRTNLAQEVADCWRKLPVPVICVIHGNCFGGGLQIALACDFRVTTPDANLSIMEMKWGLIPDMSGTLALSKLTRLDIAQELTMTGRQFSGEEAHDYGVVSHVNERPFEIAQALASKIAKQSPDAITSTKRLFQRTWQVSDTWALRWERWIQMRLLGRKNNQIAIKNGLTKDSPPRAFIDRSI